MKSMTISIDHQLQNYDFFLPEDSIARYPAVRRDQSRLLTVHRASHTIQHLHFFQLSEMIQPGDLFVLNDTKVRKIRFWGRSEKGMIHELLFLSLPGSDAQCIAVVSRRKKLKPGMLVSLPGNRILRYKKPHQEHALFELVDPNYAPIDEQYCQQFGAIPLPPYLKREAGPIDDQRYQTVFAQKTGSAAAPTASLHFTAEMLANLKRLGAEFTFLTLSVGLGTFAPVRSEDIRIHSQNMHQEEFEITQESWDTILQAKQQKRRIIPVGTTAMRTIESLWLANLSSSSKIKHPGTPITCTIQKDRIIGSTGLFIYPGFSFQLSSALITNFHTPKSTLLMLVSAFYERTRVMQIYQEAQHFGYRFFSYGDSMFLM